MRKTISGAVRTQTAGKAHQCSREDCHYPILPGQEYRRVITDDDDLLRYHIHCYTIEFPRDEG